MLKMFPIADVFGSRKEYIERREGFCPKADTIHYHAWLVFLDKGRAIKELVDLGTFDR